eukprot:2764329-Amphidinium_carterae.1
MAENAELKSSLASAAENGNGHSDGDTTNGPKPTAAATVKFCALLYRPRKRSTDIRNGPA